ncbi:MAG: M56 family metallopeptidase [Gemmatimonadota bacterium]
MEASWFTLPILSIGRGASLVGAWLLTYAVHSTVLLLTAWWLVSRRRLAWSPAARHVIWNVALVAGWLTSAAQMASPWRPLGGAWQLPEGARRVMAAVQVTQREDVRAGDRQTAPLDAGTRMRLTVVTLSRTTIAVATWAVISLVLLAHLALSRRRLLSALRERRDASETVAGGVLRHLLARTGTQRRIRLTMSDALPAPAAISHDEIVLPTRALRELTLAEQEGVLAHELAHVVRGDPRWLRLATWIERVGWFQPLNRVASRQMQLSAEFAADAWAVRVTREPLRLAQALARVAEWLSPRASSPAWHVPGADGSPLVERVRRLTTPHAAKERLGLRPAHAAMWLVAATALALLPHFDATPLLAGRVERLERVEFRFADKAQAGTLATGARQLPKPGVRFVRLIGVLGVEGRSVPPIILDSGLVHSGARRMLIVTSRASP